LTFFSDSRCRFRIAISFTFYPRCDYGYTRDGEG
jgi:hypothetical protein